MSLVLMKLGPHIFYVPQPGVDTPGYETMTADASFTIASQGRLSRDPAMQFTGPGEETYTIEGRLFPHHFGGLSTLAAIHESGRAGKPLMLMRYVPLDQGIEGQVVGKFMIRRVRRVHQKIGTSGFPHKIDFTIELVAYGDDANAQQPKSTPEFAFTSAIGQVTQPSGGIDI